MNKSCLLLSTISLVLPMLSAMANPLVNLPAGDMACTVSVTFHANQAPSVDDAPAAQAKKYLARQTVEITRVGIQRHDVVTWNNGETMELWTQVDTGVTQVEAHRGQTITDMPKGDPTRLALAPPLLNFDAESVAWITDSSRSHPPTDDHDGKPSIHYQKTIEVTRGDAPPLEVTYQAWIDPKSLIPIAFDDGDNLYELTFHKAPTEPLALPDRFKADLQHYLNANAPLRHL